MHFLFYSPSDRRQGSGLVSDEESVLGQAFLELPTLRNDLIVTFCFEANGKLLFIYSCFLVLSYELCNYYSCNHVISETYCLKKMF